MAFLEENEIPTRPGKGEYQLLQIRTIDRGWQVVFNTNNPEHLSYNKALAYIVDEFMKSLK